MARLFPMVSAETKVRNFTANATWTAPLTTTNLISANGKGAAGSPATDGEQGLLERKVTKIYQDNVLQSTTTNFKKYPDYSAALPQDQCFYESDSTGYKKETCYYHSWYDTSTEATTGASSTFAAGVAGTSRTFPGGYAGPAPTTSFFDVPVVPGQTYNVVVPSGGSITITYLE